MLPAHDQYNTHDRKQIIELTLPEDIERMKAAGGGSGGEAEALEIDDGAAASGTAIEVWAPLCAGAVDCDWACAAAALPAARQHTQYANAQVTWRLPSKLMLAPLAPHAQTHATGRLAAAQQER